VITTSAPPATRSASITSLLVTTDPEPRVRYTSGLTIYDEALVAGHWIGRYWAATGRVKPEIQLVRDLPELADESLDAFHLAIDGQALDGGWTWAGAKESETRAPSGQPLLHVVVELEHQTAPITVRVHTELDGSPFIVRWLEISNRGERTVALTGLAAWSGLLWRIRNYPMYASTEEGSVFQAGYNTGSVWGYEGDFGWQPLSNGTRHLESQTGRSGWSRPAFVAANEAQGDFFVVELAWSGNWRADLVCRQEVRFRPDQRAAGFLRDGSLPEARLSVAIGPSSPDGAALRVLGRGETLTCPSVHVGTLHGDLDQVVQNLHAHVRASVMLPPPHGRGQRIAANPNVYLFGAEGMGEQALPQQIDIAATVGVEVFYIDCGWHGFDRQQPWADNVGDWAEASWVAGGVRGIREYARGKGLLFGLWMEPEAIGAGSRLRKNHPEWEARRNGTLAGRRAGRPGGLLDLANPAAATWMESEIARVIDDYELDFFRLDFNTSPFWGATRVVDGIVENTLWRHVETL